MFNALFNSRPWQRLAAIALLCAVSPAVLMQAQNRRPVTEYDVKAAFLLNFLKFVEWPPAEEGHQRTSFSICILGEDPFGPSIDRIVEGETVNNRPVLVRRVRVLREPCEVLFVSGSERDVPAVLSELPPGTLTVGEAPEFLQDGGMINFVIDDRRVRFDINRGAAERASLRISSRLLSVARTVLR